MRADIVEASEFPELAQRYNVYAVPKTVINETVEITGAAAEPQLVAAVVRAVTGDGAGATDEDRAGGEEEVTLLTPEFEDGAR